MKVLLTQDVFNLGHAGDVKNVADGYGRNFLLPRGMAVLATPAALKRAERIKVAATEKRAREKSDVDALAEVIGGSTFTFVVRAGELQSVALAERFAFLGVARDQRDQLRVLGGVFERRQDRHLGDVARADHRVTYFA